MFYFILILYNLFFPVAALLLAPAWIMKMHRRGGWGTGLVQRIGCYSPSLLERARGSDYYHAVSVGEVVMALKVIREMQADQPSYHCVLAVTTATGHAVAQAQKPLGLTLIYSPLDLFPVLHRLFAKVAPRQVILVDSELWPNLLVYLKMKKIPVSVINGRLSERSFSRYQRARFFVKPLVSSLSLVCVEEETQAARWAALGVKRTCIKTVGSLKFDFSTPHSELRSPSTHPALQVKESKKKPFLLLTSTHSGEEEALLQELSPLDSCLFGVVPRHAERAAEVAHDLSLLGLKTLPASSYSEFLESDRAVLLVDTTGELPLWIGAADLVIIGKSWLKTGGQNPFESLAAGVPTLCGPHMQNFEPLVGELAARELLIQLPALGALRERVASFLGAPERDRAAAQRGSQYLMEKAGAASRTARALRDRSAR